MYGSFALLLRSPLVLGHFYICASIFEGAGVIDAVKEKYARVRLFMVYRMPTAIVLVIDVLASYCI